MFEVVSIETLHRWGITTERFFGPENIAEYRDGKLNYVKCVGIDIAIAAIDPETKQTSSSSIV